tara:strand:- start:679 stop:915 length:237 start_codon:yes stop_codon:yes gene_type:complete
MSSRYYIINSSSYSTVENDLEHSPVWNVSGSECIIEVAVGYDPPSYFKKFRTSNECQDYINNSIRIDEWWQPDVSELP